ncbi:MAG TPA: methyltransferase domain-containing protein [Rhabdochlamydiaceae bacterium]|nr:methyltransferase domain-containing protein [Rhabdochlamydiaceae bacterium]
MSSKRLETKSNKTHHSLHGTLEKAVADLEVKIRERGDLPSVSVDEQIAVLQDLIQFPLGRFIVEKKGANGFWTDYMITFPETRRKTGRNIEGKPLSKWEDFLVNRSPVVLASQERYKIFQRTAQSLIKDGVVLASIPCGVMNDLLTLDYSNVANFKLIGIDIDKESIDLAKKQAEAKNSRSVEFRIQNAWELEDQNSFDVITSSGLNVYEDDIEKVLELYRQFYRALKPGGVLITSVLTYPPGEGKKTDWDLTGMSEETLRMEQILHKEILGVKWRNFCSINEIELQFMKAGFSKVDVILDRRRIFPTVIAYK